MKKIITLAAATVAALSLFTSCLGSQWDGFAESGTHWIAAVNLSDNMTNNENLCNTLGTYFYNRNYGFYGFQKDTQEATNSFDSDVNIIKEVAGPEFEAETNCYIVLYKITDDPDNPQEVKRAFVEFYAPDEE